eukprot:451234_1
MSLAFVALSLIIQSVHCMCINCKSNTNQITLHYYLAQDEEANSHDLETTKKMESKNNELYVLICVSIVGLILVVCIIWCCLSNSQATHKEIAHHTVLQSDEIDEQMNESDEVEAQVDGINQQTEQTKIVQDV